MIFSFLLIYINTSLKTWLNGLISRLSNKVINLTGSSLFSSCHPSIKSTVSKLLVCSEMYLSKKCNNYCRDARNFIGKLENSTDHGENFKVLQLQQI